MDLTKSLSGSFDIVILVYLCFFLEASVLLLVEEVAISHAIVWIVTSQRFWGDLGVGVSEVNVSHVICVVEEIWVQSVIVPEVVRIVESFTMSLDHHEVGSCKSVGYVSPHYWPKQVEVRVDWSHQLVVWMGRERLVRRQVGECVVELVGTMLHQAVGPKCKNAHPWHGVCPPVTVQVHVDVAVEDTVSTPDCVSLNTLSEVAWLFWQTLNFIEGRPSIRLIES